MLREAAREFLGQACTVALRRAARSDSQASLQPLWQEMARLGWMGFIIPERYGGAGASFVDLAVLLEEMGRVCLPGPYLSSAVLGTLCLLDLATEREHEELLPRVAVGALKLALVRREGACAFEPGAPGLRTVQSAHGRALQGTELLVADAAAADLLICIAVSAKRTPEECSLIVVPRGDLHVRLTSMPTIEGVRHYEVAIDCFPIEEEVSLGPAGPQRLQQLFLKAAIAKCAEIVGAAQRVLDLAVTHAREREQFDRPIGSFQAVQHHCVNMLMDLECARWLTYKSAAAIDQGALRPEQAAKTKVWCNQAYRRIVQLGHQVLGGMGYCEEHEMPLFFRHARMAEVTLGDSDSHLEVVAESLLGRRWSDAPTAQR